jgi:hypothetical protein
MGVPISKFNVHDPCDFTRDGRTQYGHIVNIGFNRGLMAYEGGNVYGASKASSRSSAVICGPMSPEPLSGYQY